MISTQDIEIGDQALRVTNLRDVLGTRLERLPFVLRLLAENHLRETGAAAPLLKALDAWLDGQSHGFELTLRPNRILMHDTTCTPALADVAGLRDAVFEAGADPAILSPTLPVDVSVDHSLAVDIYASRNAFSQNSSNEVARNYERYAFLKWASQNMQDVRVHPPGTGIMHTINLEQLATVLQIHHDGTAHPDFLLGTDSHTPMINGIGVLGWGIGGLEAESVMFGQAVSLALPKIVGVRLNGALPVGTFSTDLALEVTHRLRALDVAGSFVEFFGPGVASLTADARAVIANMAPEYGASTGYFPVDAETVAYLERTGRPTTLTRCIEPVFRAMGLGFETCDQIRFDQTVEIDLNSIRPTIAGPRRPQDKCAPNEAAKRIEDAIGRGLGPAPLGEKNVPDGAVGIAAITSCTNTSDPGLLVAAGLLARKARKLGLKPPEWVKTSLAPGSPAARDYLKRSGLDADLSALGFDIVGHGCTTCIGNSGPLPDAIEQALLDGKAVSAVLSGNRNFPGRVHPKLNLGFLASPPLVVAYALKGDIHGDVLNDTLGVSSDGQQVFLQDIWPKQEEIDEALSIGYRQEDVSRAFARASKNEDWDQIEAATGATFPWDPASRYLRRPKFASLKETSRLGKISAVPLMVLGNDMTTDHISPAGWIDPNSIAGQWLIERGGDPRNLNVYAAYRGNWEVMLRGLFTNALAINHLQVGLGPAETVLEDDVVLPIADAADKLTARGQASVLLAGERYGMGSSRDWAAKGVALLNVRAVIARSFERIHRTNLIGMGVIPVQILNGFDPQSAGISAHDRFELDVESQSLVPQKTTDVCWHRAGGTVEIPCKVAVETAHEVELLRQGGVLSAILNDVVRNAEGKTQ